MSGSLRDPINAEIARLWLDGLKAVEIGDRIDRDVKFVTNRIHEMRRDGVDLPRRWRKLDDRVAITRQPSHHGPRTVSGLPRRRCLTCARGFQPEHRTNFVCPTCKGSGAWQMGA